MRGTRARYLQADMGYMDYNLLPRLRRAAPITSMDSSSVIKLDLRTTVRASDPGKTRNDIPDLN
ncbi:MAG TPA: hypothetical protein VEV84_10130 [Pyrinomonadaceae bacterium]|nr:hypothetical protein [Pyrinomonadaceae bacterium]